MQEQFIKISSFAKLSGIPRKNLIEYDKKGILKPAYLDSENQYRYYSYRQMDTAMIIKILRELDMSLREIKEYIDHRSPSDFICLCNNQKHIIQEKVKRLQHMDMVLDTHINKSIEGMEVHELNISLVECEEERIFIGNPLPPSTASIDLWRNYPDFLSQCKAADIPTGFPTGIVVAQNELVKNMGQCVNNIYCNLPLDFASDRTTIKPAGLYVVGYDYQDHTFSNRNYEKLFDYIENNLLTINGDAYEFYLFDELSFLEPNKYLVKTSIPVKHK